jgi:hypothetical protein
MTSKHSISCVALSAAVAFKLFAGMADIAADGAKTDARKGRVLLTVLHDASGQDGSRFYAGRFIFTQGNGKTPVSGGVNIAATDGEIV